MSPGPSLSLSNSLAPPPPSFLGSLRAAAHTSPPAPRSAPSVRIYIAESTVRASRTVETAYFPKNPPPPSPPVESAARVTPAHPPPLPSHRSRNEFGADVAATLAAGIAPLTALKGLALTYAARLARVVRGGGGSRKETRLFGGVRGRGGGRGGGCSPVTGVRGGEGVQGGSCGEWARRGTVLFLECVCMRARGQAKLPPPSRGRDGACARSEHVGWRGGFLDLGCAIL